MARHIDIGGYTLVQNSKTVGELRVVAGSSPTDVVEQWLLYTSLGEGAGEGVAVYSRPSSTNTSVALTLTATTLSWSDPEERQYALSQEDITADYVRGEATAPSTVAPPDMSSNNASQIDVGWYSVLQGGNIVGQVAVSVVSGNETLESWYLYVAVPSGEQNPPVATYTVPNSTNGGSYTLEYIDTAPPNQTDSGYEASQVDVSCVTSSL